MDIDKDFAEDLKQLKNGIYTLSMIIIQYAMEVYNIYLAICMCSTTLAKFLCAIFMVILHSCVASNILDYMTNGKSSELSNNIVRKTFADIDTTNDFDELIEIRKNYNWSVLLGYTAINVILFCIQNI